MTGMPAEWGSVNASQCESVAGRAVREKVEQSYVIHYSIEHTKTIHNVVINVMMVVWYKLHGDSTACKESGEKRKRAETCSSVLFLLSPLSFQAVKLEICTCYKPACEHSLT